MRGTDPLAADKLLSLRFIPACAGNRIFWPQPEICTPVHPRVCGEQLDVAHLTSCQYGSSPRVRGTEKIDQDHMLRSRFIPACAGNSSSEWCWRIGRAVHPRVCGEQLTSSKIKITQSGSSPRVRGTAWNFGLGRDNHRFIPACAGNRSMMVLQGQAPSVHPRVCGEQPLSTAAEARTYGSSPRVRGTGFIYLRLSDTRRFIPACAGNSNPPRPPCGATPVHPRVCGEQTANADRGIARSGSSPRVRGTVGLATAVEREVRFIPACAGNSL